MHGIQRSQNRTALVMEKEEAGTEGEHWPGQVPQAWA